MNNRFGIFTTPEQTQRLERGLGAGLVWLLLGLFLLPSSKLYHQGLIFLFWLPGALALFNSNVRAAWDLRLLALFGLSAGWASLSLLWGGEPRQLKEILYVLLSLNACIAAAALNTRLFWKLLVISAFVGGLLAWLALVYFYLLQGNSWEERSTATGQLNHTILASHVLGALCLILVYLRWRLPKALQRSAWIFACSGYLAFLLMSRTKGTLLALVACLILSYLWKPSRRAMIVAGTTLLCSLIAVWQFPAEVLRGGFSSRPELFQLAWEHYLQHPWLGLGVDGKYLLTVPSTGATFEHAHNLYAHIALQLGAVGLLLWLLLLAGVALRGWSMRKTAQGRTVCALLCFGGIALLTDGTGPWVKPREEWFTIWLPIFLGFALKQNPSRPSPAQDCCHCPLG